jgi:hypothetical protein
MEDEEMTDEEREEEALIDRILDAISAYATEQPSGKVGWLTVTRALTGAIGVQFCHLAGREDYGQFVERLMAGMAEQLDLMSKPLSEHDAVEGRSKFRIISPTEMPD